MSCIGINKRDDREQCEGSQLEAHQQLLDPCRDLNAFPADERQQHDEDDAEQGDGEHAVGGGVDAEEFVAVDTGDLGLAGVDDDSRENSDPSAEPAPAWAHGSGHPREGGTTVRIDGIKLAEGQRDEQHRQERHDDHRRHVRAHATDGGDEPDGGGKSVGRGRGGDRDGKTTEEADGSVSQLRRAAAGGVVAGGHGRGIAHCGCHSGVSPWEAG